MKHKFRKKQIVRCLNRLTIEPEGNGNQGGAGGTGDAGNTGNTSGQQQQQQNGNQGNQQQQSGQQNNDQSILNPWVPSATLNAQAPPPAQPGQPPAQPAVPAAPVVDPAKQMAEFITGLNMTEGIDLANLQTDLADGKTDSLNAAFETVAANVFQQSMLQTNKLVQNSIDKAVATAVEKSTGAVHSDLAVRSLGDKFSFTKDPAIAPIAKAALASFLQQPGMDMDKAVVKTGEFFKQMLGHIGKTNADFLPPPSGPGGQPFGGEGPANLGKNDIVPDWLEVLAPGIGNQQSS